MSYSLSSIEREVVITFNAGENTAELYTADPVYMRKLDKLVQQNPEQYKEIRQEKLEGKVVAKRYEFPKAFVCLRGKKRKNTMTEEQRKAAAERMRNIRTKSSS